MQWCVAFSVSSPFDRELRVVRMNYVVPPDTFSHWSGRKPSIIHHRNCHIHHTSRRHACSKSVPCLSKCRYKPLTMHSFDNLHQHKLHQLVAILSPRHTKHHFLVDYLRSEAQDMFVEASCRWNRLHRYRRHHHHRCQP